MMGGKRTGGCQPEASFRRERVGKVMTFSDANRTRAKEIVARYPQPEVGDLAARASRAGPGRLVVARSDE